MRNRFRSLLLFSARLLVGYPAAWLRAMSSGHLLARCQSLFYWLLRVPVTQGAAHLAPQNGAELTLIGLAVTVSTFILTLWLLQV
jgi:hypothetical protein